MQGGGAVAASVPLSSIFPHSDQSAAEPEDCSRPGTGPCPATSLPTIMEDTHQAGPSGNKENLHPPATTVHQEENGEYRQIICHTNNVNQTLDIIQIKRAKG